MLYGQDPGGATPLYGLSPPVRFLPGFYLALSILPPLYTALSHYSGPITCPSPSECLRNEPDTRT